MDEHSEIGSELIRKHANKIAQLCKKEQDNLLEIKEQPGFINHFRHRKSVIDCVGEPDQLTDEDYERVYKISESDDARFLNKMLNKRKKLASIYREYNRENTRFGRLKRLETILAKRVDCQSANLNSGDGNNNNDLDKLKSSADGADGRRTSEQQDNMEHADLLLDMSPGIQRRKQSTKSITKAAGSLLFGKKVRHMIHTLGGMLSIAADGSNRRVGHRGSGSDLGSDYDSQLDNISEEYEGSDGESYADDDILPAASGGEDEDQSKSFLGKIFGSSSKNE